MKAALAPDRPPPRPTRARPPRAARARRRPRRAWASPPATRPRRPRSRAGASGKTAVIYFRRRRRAELPKEAAAFDAAGLGATVVGVRRGRVKDGFAQECVGEP